MKENNPPKFIFVEKQVNRLSFRVGQRYFYEFRINDKIVVKEFEITHIRSNTIFYKFVEDLDNPDIVESNMHIHSVMADRIEPKQYINFSWNPEDYILTSRFKKTEFVNNYVSHKVTESKEYWVIEYMKFDSDTPVKKDVINVVSNSTPIIKEYFFRQLSSTFLLEHKLYQINNNLLNKYGSEIDYSKIQKYIDIVIYQAINGFENKPTFEPNELFGKLMGFDYIKINFKSKK